jgi:hypothetical protein
MLLVVALFATVFASRCFDKIRERTERQGQIMLLEGKLSALEHVRADIDRQQEAIPFNMNWGTIDDPMIVEAPMATIKERLKTLKR